MSSSDVFFMDGNDVCVSRPANVHSVMNGLKVDHEIVNEY